MAIVPTPTAFVNGEFLDSVRLNAATFAMDQFAQNPPAVRINIPANTSLTTTANAWANLTLGTPTELFDTDTMFPATTLLNDGIRINTTGLYHLETTLFVQSAAANTSRAVAIYDNTNGIYLAQGGQTNPTTTTVYGSLTASGIYKLSAGVEIRLRMFSTATANTTSAAGATTEVSYLAAMWVGRG